LKQEIISFETGPLFKKWLTKFHQQSQGLWLRIFKKSSEKKSITYDEALEEALCVGWIDGQKKSYDEKSWLQKFTPRRPKSVWSKRNTTIVEKLIKAKRMKPAGFKVVEEAKEDGRWEQAYASQKDMKVPEDFLVQLKKNKKAHEFFKTLNKANLYSIAWRLQTAKKPETRTRHLVSIVQMLAKRENF
jgi:uncharacterized protein YdeI (YjbR/CyaY-like superfamily)